MSQSAASSDPTDSSPSDNMLGTEPALNTSWAFPSLPNVHMTTSKPDKGMESSIESALGTGSSIASSSSKIATGSPFFDTLLAEIRLEIYKLLLVSPLLGQTQTGFYYESEDGYQRLVRYKLAIDILTTCKQAYKEGSDVLYECNTFAFTCLEGNNGWGCTWDTPMCPFLKVPWGDYSIRDTFLKVISVTSRVRRWRVLLSGSMERCKHPSSVLVQFFKAICQDRLQLLEVLVIPEGVERPAPRLSAYEDITQVLLPLRLLRNVPKWSLTIRDAHLEEVPLSHVDNWQHSSHRTLTSLLPNANVQRNMVLLAESNNPVDFVSEMYPVLLRYARSLERYKPFKIDMDPADYYNPPVGRYRQGYVNNPFKSANGAHPVEEGLGTAAYLVEAEDITQFKRIRDDVLQYLETQYQRIMAASLNITDFIKREKRPKGLFDCTIDTLLDQYERDSFDRYITAEAYLLLQQYVESFHRDIPFQIQIQMKSSHLFDALYYENEREGCLADMLRAMRLEDVERSISLFKHAFRHMEL